MADQQESAPIPAWVVVGLATPVSVRLVGVLPTLAMAFAAGVVNAVLRWRFARRPDPRNAGGEA